MITISKVYESFELNKRKNNQYPYILNQKNKKNEISFASILEEKIKKG